MHAVSDQPADESFRIPEGLAIEEKTVLAGFFHHQLESQLEIGDQPAGKRLQGNRIIYKLFHDEVNSVFLQNDIDVMRFEEIKFDLFDLVLTGFDMLEDLAHI